MDIIKLTESLRKFVINILKLRNSLTSFSFKTPHIRSLSQAISFIILLFAFFLSLSLKLKQKIK